MDKDDIMNDINNVVAQSPVEQQQQAKKNIPASGAPSADGQSTFVTGDLEGNVADQTVTTPDRGVAFTPNTTEVYTGGTALPNLNYNTRRQTPADRGNPLYFEPNYQPVVPFDVGTPYGTFKSKTLDSEKLAWEIAVSIAGRHDDNYIGYKEMPRAGSLGWGSLWLGAAKSAFYNFIPEEVKGISSVAHGIPAAYLREQIRIEKDYLADAYDMTFDDGEERKPNLDARARKQINKLSDEDKNKHLARIEELSYWADGYQFVQDQVEDCMNWVEQHYGNTLDADFTDTSGKAQTARGVASGMVNFGAALLSRDPKAVFMFLNFAGQNQMRKNALNAGLSPSYADVYSIAGSGVNSILDMFQFEAITGGFKLTRKAVYDLMKKEGFYKFHIGRALANNAVDMFVVEPLTEMTQEGIEGWYDPEFLENQEDRLAVAAVSAMALKAAMLPSAVRHAKSSERLAVAQALGVDTQFVSLVKDAKDTLNRWAEEGKIDPKNIDNIMEMIISRAPDQIVKEIRDGTLGQLDKVSPEERRQFAELLSNVDKNSITKKEFDALDVRVDENLKDVDLPDSQKTMIKGIVRGLAQIKLLQDGTAPSEIRVPNFVVRPRQRGSQYNATTNTITISSVWSDTEFTRARGASGTEYNQLVREGFIPSSAQSDRMASVIHEMAHWVDHQVGEKGFSDFLEHYYNNIANVFGNERALKVYNASKQGAKRMPRETSRNYTSVGNATENNAQAVTRLGKRSAAQFGLSNSQAARFLSYANVMFNQMGEWTKAAGMKRNAKIFGDYQTAVQSITKQNMDVIQDLIDVFGDDELRRMVKDFLNDTENPNEDFAEYLARNDALKKLFDVMDSFADVAGVQKIAPLFSSAEEIHSFVDKGDIYFRSGYDNAVAEIKEKRAERAKKAAESAGEIKAPQKAKNNAKQVQLQNGTTASIIPEGKNGQPDFSKSKIIDSVRALLAPDDEASGDDVHNEFIGVQANLPITQELGRAQQMMEQKVDQQQIFKETGWFFDGKDGKWKYEIPSGEIIDSVTPNQAQLSLMDLLYKNDELYKAYPQLKDIPVFLYPSEQESGKTSYNKDGTLKDITIKYDASKGNESARYVLVHELQHVIQGIEGFAVGGAPESNTEKGWRDYERLAGEIEARNVQKRLTTNKLLEGLGNTKYTLPTQTQDISDADAIVKFNDVKIAKYVPKQNINEDRIAVEDYGIYDNENGIGATGINRDAKYGGWKTAIVTMTPDEFLSLVPPVTEGVDDSTSYIEKAIKDGKKIAMPFLNIPKFVNEDTDSGHIIVSQHEGRHRALALKNLGIETMDVILTGDTLLDSKYANGLSGVVLQKYGEAGNKGVKIQNIKTEPVLRGQDYYHPEYEDVIPNDYTAGTNPVEEIQKTYDRAQKQDPADEEPSYAKKVDGRDLGEDIDSLRDGIMQRAKNLPNKLVKWFASSPWGWGLDRIVTTMFGRGASDKLDIAGKYTRRNALRSKMYGTFMQELAPIICDVTQNKTAAMFKYKTMLNNLGFVRVSDVEINDPYNSEITSKRDLTGWEVMYVYLMKRMGTKYANRIQQSTKTNIDELIATLSDEEKQFADAMSNTLRGVWSKIVGEDKAVYNYFPILDARHAMLDEVNIDTFKERMETDSPIAIDDAGRIFSKDISRIASWQSGYYQTLKRLRDTLQYKGAEGRNINPEIDEQLKKTSSLLAGQISQVFGRDAYHNLLRLLDTQISDPQDQMLDSASSKTLQQMGNNIIKSMLSFKFMSLPKNLSNITMMWGGASDQSVYWNGFAEGIANKARTWKYMMDHSDEIRMRYNDAGYNEFLDQRNTGGSTAPIFKGISKIFANLDWTGDKTGGMAKMSAALDMMGDEGLKLFMLNGDAVANIYGGYGLIKDYMAQGLTEDQAFKKLDRYIVEHQSSSNLAMKPLGQLRANKSLAGQVMAFTSEGVAKWSSILGTFDEVKMGTATMSQAIANAMSIAMSMLLFTALSAGVWDLWDDDEKVQEEAVKSLEGAMIDQLFGGSVLGNGFLTPAVQGMMGLGGNMGISAPLWSFMTEGITNLKRGEYERVITKSMEATGILVGANALYNDILGMMFLNSDDPDIREAGFRMLAGRTMGYAEKRTGAKIKDTEDENVENSDEE